jgi:hypothetical protein
MEVTSGSYLPFSTIPVPSGYGFKGTEVHLPKNWGLAQKRDCRWATKKWKVHSWRLCLSHRSQAPLATWILGPVSHVAFGQDNWLGSVNGASQIMEGALTARYGEFNQKFVLFLFWNGQRYFDQRGFPSLIAPVPSRRRVYLTLRK